MTGITATDPRLRRPTALRLFAAQLRHACTELWRTRVVFVFTFLFPLTWLVLLGFLIGDEVVDQASGVRVMQFIVPTAAAMGVLYATLPTVATGLAIARESGVLKRVHGTPLPAWLYLAGRLGGSVVFAFASVVTMLLTGVVAYGVQIVWRTVPATVVTLVVAIACFSALGLAVAGLARSSSSAQVISIGGAVLLSFVSGLYTPGGGMPGWAERIASILPLKPLMDALQDQFNPFGTGDGWNLTALAVLTAWALVGGAIAAKAFRWAPARARRVRADDAATHPVPSNGSSTGSLGAVPVGSYLPLEPVMTSLTAALSPTGPSVIWRDLLVLISWLLVGGLLAYRQFPWHGNSSLPGKVRAGVRSS